MIIKIFKLSTKEMWVLKHKKSLLEFIEQETGHILPSLFTINDLVRYLPVENYHRVK